MFYWKPTNIYEVKYFILIKVLLVAIPVIKKERNTKAVNYFLPKLVYLIFILRSQFKLFIYFVIHRKKEQWRNKNVSIFLCHKMKNL